MTFGAYLVTLALIGLIVGPLARLSLPGRDPMSAGQTLLLGEAAAFVAGVGLWYATDGAYAATIPICTLVGTAFVYVVRRRRGGSLTDPGQPPPR